jgi:hypothetical protein
LAAIRYKKKRFIQIYRINSITRWYCRVCALICAVSGELLPPSPSHRVTARKKQLLSGALQMFADGRIRKEECSADEEELYEQIGRLKMA